MLEAAGELRREGWRIGALRAPAGACLFEGAAVTADRLLFYAAILMIEPVEAAGLNYIWIPGVFVYGLLLSGGKPGARHWFGGLYVAAAMAAMAAGGIEAGHVLALGAGLVWAWYVVKGASIPGRGGKASAIGHMATGSLVLLLALAAGNRWDVAAGDVFWLVGLLVMSNAGFVLWEFGARHGDGRAGKIAVLFAPLMAVIWIWTLGAGALDAPQLFAMAAMSAAGLIVSPHVFRAAKTARS
jgi:drug/metabolite transporter (DMT)-like permease